MSAPTKKRPNNVLTVGIRPLFDEAGQDLFTAGARRICDTQRIRRFAELTLRGAGYEVVLASDGPEALRIVDAQAVRFDLFVSDLMMPQMRGDELARQLRQRDPDARVLYLTGYSDRLFAEWHVLWEHLAFVDKPVTIKGLLEAVSMIVFGHTRGPEGDRPTDS